LNKLELLKDKIFKETNIDGFLILNKFNLLYLTGLMGSSAMLISRDNDSRLYSYDVNYAYLKKEIKETYVERVKPGENILKKIIKKTKDYKIKNLSLDSATIETWNNLTKFSNKTVKLEIDRNLIQNMRKVKNKDEIKLLKKAAELTVKAMKVAAQVISPGIKESEVAAEVEYLIRKHDFCGIAFETIVASGNGSAFPHGGISDKKIKGGELVVVDIGAKYKNYCSDMTRTFVVGKASLKQQRIIQITKRAQLEALNSLKDGANAKNVDKNARKIIERERFGEYFVHSLGHGVGLEVHEKPILSSVSKDEIVAGNVVTIEPGIYIVGYGGVRIEDTVIVKKDGIEKLTDGINNFEI
jgi:Xaa-Pro aminopeptidase